MWARRGSRSCSATPDARPHGRALKVHAIDNAKVSAAAKNFPLLVFSPGFDESSLTYASTLEDLASHGYVIAAIDHPYDATCVTLPDGRLSRSLKQSGTPPGRPRQK